MTKPKTKTSNERSAPVGCSMADDIVEDLFKNGFGDKAGRLLLEVPGIPLGNAGGWCRGAVHDIIMKHYNLRH